jgi:hypothetical protein
METVTNSFDIKQININLEALKNNPKLISLMKKIRKCRINIDQLNEFETIELFKCILIVSR